MATQNFKPATRFFLLRFLSNDEALSIKHLQIFLHYLQ